MSFGIIIHKLKENNDCLLLVLSEMSTAAATNRSGIRGACGEKEDEVI
jgi:hypothetical protein